MEALTWCSLTLRLIHGGWKLVKYIPTWRLGLHIVGFCKPKLNWYDLICRYVGHLLENRCCRAHLMVVSNCFSFFIWKRCTSYCLLFSILYSFDCKEKRDENEQAKTKHNCFHDASARIGEFCFPHYCLSHLNIGHVICPVPHTRAP